jgi:hypothetical protein
VPWAREPRISFLFTPKATREQLEAAGFRVLVWQDTTEPSREAARQRAQAAEASTPLGTHVILGSDWQEMAKNSLRNLEEQRTELFNAVLERVG